MDRFDRIYDLHKLLSSSRYPVSRERIEQELECSRATAKRIIESMRLYLDAPIKYDRTRNGYYYDGDQQALYELPGLWFNASELHALLSVQQLLADVQPGLLDKQLQQLISRIDKLLALQNTRSTNSDSGNSDSGSRTHDNIQNRVRILQIASRTSSAFFQQVAGATVQRKRLLIDYFHRHRNTTEQRELSPLQLVHYRDNWYLDAWCHQRDALRTFSLDAIRQARILDSTADEIPKSELDDHFGSAYGIFSGKADKTATLVFSEKIARWISHEKWHPQQQGCTLDDGRYELQLPFNNPTELIMDILRYGPDVEVIGPEDLRQAVIEKHQQSVELYVNQNKTQV